MFPHTLLVTFTPGDAMRQTYFKDNEIKFSRLTPGRPRGQGQTLGAMIAEETTRTWQYLDSLRHFGPDDRLEVCVLVHPTDRAAVQPELRDFAQIQYRVIDIEQAVDEAGVEARRRSTRRAEEVMVHLFLLRPAANHFASPELRRYAHAAARAHRDQPGRGRWCSPRASPGAATTCRARSRPRRSTTRSCARSPTSPAEYEEVNRATCRRFGVGGATMRDAVAFYNTRIKGFPSLPEFLRPLSAVLAGASRRAPATGLVAGHRRREGHAAHGHGRRAQLAPPVTATRKGPETRVRAAAVARVRGEPAVRRRALRGGADRGHGARHRERLSAARSPRCRRSRIDRAHPRLHAPTWSRARSTCAPRSRSRAASGSATRPPWSRASCCA